MNEKWFSLSVSDIEKKLKTNAALGLTHKAARSRFSYKNGFIFELEPRTLFSFVPSLISDFSVIILLLMSVVALCFDEKATGGVTLFVSVMSLALSLVFYYRDQRYFASAARSLSPRCRVIRQGRLYSLAPRHVVVGDIILLGEGDVVPADARLITSDSLKVRMLVEKNKYVQIDKLAEGAVVASENDPVRFVNMVHAGSVVVGGAARAVVTAVGQYTYAGAKIGNIEATPSAEKSTPRLLVRLKKTLSLVSIALLAATLPISLVAMLLGGDSLSLFSVFMTVVSAAFLCSTQLVHTLFRIFYEIPAKRCIMTRDAAVIRSPYSLDALASTKYVFLLDGGALTDGIWHLDGVCLGEGEHTKYDAPTASVKRLSELAHLYLDAKKAGLAVGNERYNRYDDAIREFRDRSGVDKDALMIRCSTSGYIENSAASPCDKVMFSELGEKYVLSVCYSDNIISECAYACFEDGVLEANEAFRYSARQTFRNYSEIGKRALIFCVAKNEGYGVEGEKCFVGMIVFSEHTDGVAEKAKKDIEARGIKVVSFKNIIVDGAPELSKIPESLLGDVRADIRDFVAASKPLSQGLGEIDCYVNLTTRQIEELIGYIHERGESVVAVGICDKFERIYRAADAVVTVSLDKFSVDNLENVVKVKIDPNETRTEAGAQSIGRTADAVIPRYADGKGGLSSLLTAFRGASMAANNLLGYFRYLVLAHTVRLALILLPMLLGSVTADARHLLLVGAVSDMLALFAFAHDGNTAAKGYSPAMRAVASPIGANGRAMLIFGVGAVLSTLLPPILSLIPGLPAYIDKVEYSFVSLVLFHVAVFLSIRLTVGRGAGKLTVIAPVTLCALLGLSFVGGIADIFDIEGFSSIIYFFVSLVSPLASGIVFFFFGKKRRIKKANCK